MLENEPKTCLSEKHRDYGEVINVPILQPVVEFALLPDDVVNAFSQTFDVVGVLATKMSELLLARNELCTCVTSRETGFD